jgi:hypothetical protein
MAKTKMFRFNVKNVKYTVKSGSGFSSPNDLAYANSISLESDYEELRVFGDGEVIGIVASDTSKTGTLSVTNIETQYETDTHKVMQVDSGLADIKTSIPVPHNIYFEVEGFEDGQHITIKNWLLNVTTGKATETYNQNTDTPTINNFEYPVVVTGVDLLTADGEDEYFDNNGNNVKVYKISSFPGDTNYETFGDTTPEPKFVTPSEVVEPPVEETEEE